MQARWPRNRASRTNFTLISLIAGSHIDAQHYGTAFSLSVSGDHQNTGPQKFVPPRPQAYSRHAASVETVPPGIVSGWPTMMGATIGTSCAFIATLPLAARRCSDCHWHRLAKLLGL
jgi:hypothetical protein